MNNYLDGFLSIIPPGEKDRLMRMVKDEYDIEGNVERSIKNLLDQLSRSAYEPTVEYRPQSDKTDSRSYNKMLNEIHADLHALFNQSNIIDRTIYNQQVLDKSIIDEINKKLKKMEYKINTLDLIAENIADGFVSVSFESFLDQSMTETDRDGHPSYFFDKNGDVIQSDNHIDPDAEALKLPLLSDHTPTIESIEILEQTGQGFSNSSEKHGIDKAIDESDSTFWGEVILADQPMDVPVKIKAPDNGNQVADIAGVSKTAPTEIKVRGGAICRFEIKFATPSLISELNFKPFAEFPMEIIDIAYYDREMASNPSGWIVSPVHDNEDQRYFKSEDVMTVSFPGVIAKSIVVTTRVLEYKRNTYKVSKSDKNKQETWEKIAKAEYDVTVDGSDEIWENGIDDDENPTLTQDKIDELDVAWQSFQEEVAKLEQEDDISEFLTIGTAALALILAGSPIGIVNQLTAIGITSAVISKILDDIGKKLKYERIEVDKYEYVYGFYNIGVKSQTYESKGIHISKVHDAPSNIQHIALETTEQHPVYTEDNKTIKRDIMNNGAQEPTDEPMRFTSVEYYVTHLDKTEDGGWLPILPLGQTDIKNELLLFNSENLDAISSLRFTADENTLQVYKDGVPLIKNSEWWVTKREKDNGSIVGVTQVEIARNVYSNSSYFTVYYKPATDKPYIKDLDPEKIDVPAKNMVEEFNGADRNYTVELSHYPYIDRAKLAAEDYTYNPVSATLKGSFIGKPQGGRNEVKKIYSTRLEDGLRNSQARLLNVTDYYNNVMLSMNNYDPTDDIPTFEYQHVGKKLYFTEQFKHSTYNNVDEAHGNGIIRVEYKYLPSNIRIKIIMRQTSSNEKYNAATPIIEDYKLKFRTL